MEAGQPQCGRESARIYRRGKKAASGGVDITGSERVMMCAGCEAFSFGQWLFDWQTLISGLLAVFAASVTIYYLGRQISDERARHREVVEADREAFLRRTMMARAHLPLSLGDLCRYTELVFNFLPWSQFGEAVTGEKRALPPIPKDALTDIRNCIEFAEEGAARRLTEVLQQFQVARSNLEADHIPAGNATIERAFEHVHLRYLLNTMFAYARLKTDKLEDPPDIPHACMVARDECETLTQQAPNDRTALADMIAAKMDPAGYERFRQGGSMELRG